MPLFKLDQQTLIIVTVLAFRAVEQLDVIEYIHPSRFAARFNSTVPERLHCKFAMTAIERILPASSRESCHLALN
jgi:hypothetical protein